MKLFKKFRDTVFYKEDSSLEKQLDELKKIREKLEDKGKIDKDIKKLEYGIAGEKEIAFELKNANIGMYVLRDVTFEYDGSKAQIDYLILTRGNFYIAECKNLYGNITVDSEGQFYREYEYDGKIIKEGIYSPYTQAVRQKNIMEKIWDLSHSTIVSLLHEKIYDKLHNDYLFRPIVVFSNSKCILDIQNAPKKIKDSIVRADQLIDYIKKDIDKMDSAELASEKTLKRIAETWLSKSISNDSNIVNKYLINDKNEIENKLKTFRDERANKLNIPINYIFTDEELNKLIKIMPKTIEDIKFNNILPDIKIKCHGEEIINILNKFQ